MRPRSSEEQRQVDEQTRQQIIRSTDQSTLVEAAAGTGKTTLLVDRILSGIRRGDFRLARLVAITFTEKAAAELESRLRQGLRGLSDDASLNPAERERAAEAREQLDRANISTIHSFCATLLRERPVEAGVDPDFEVLDATGETLLQEKCWENWIGEQVQKPEGTPLVDAMVGGVSISSGGRYSSGLQDLANSIVESPEVLDRSDFQLGRPPSSSSELAGKLRQKAEEVGRYIENCMKSSNENSRRIRRAVDRLNGLDPGDMRGLRAIAMDIASTRPEDAITSFEKDSRDRGLEILGELAELGSDLMSHLACELLDWLKGFANHFAEEKRRRSVLTFSDLLRRAALMLRENADARRHFQNRFDAFFVDEFQDTDPLQAEIIAYLCEQPAQSPADDYRRVELEPGKLFVVGDPKQSIYRFRRADVEVYEEFKKLFEGSGENEDGVRQVFRNFRSTAPLIESINAVFNQLLTPSPEAGVYQAPNVPLVAAEDSPNQSACPVVALYPSENHTRDEWRAPEARQQEARSVARFIRQAVEDSLPEPVDRAAGGELEYASFACLFRALTSVDIYEEALESEGVPYRVIGGKSFYQREEISETLVLLQAIDDPLDHVSVAGALRSSYFGLSDEDLLRFRQNGGRWNYLRSPVKTGPVGESMEMLARWHRHRNDLPPQVLMRRILDETKAMETFYLKPAGEQRAANLRKLQGQLRSFWGTARESFRSTINYLGGLYRRQEAEEESSVVEPGDDFVSLMSIHKSKGLQYRSIVLPDLARRANQPAPGLLIDRSSRRLAIRAGSGIESRHYQDLLEREQGNEIEEQKRLLYVAATRAENLLVLPLFWSSRRRSRNSFLSFLQQTGYFAEPADVPYGKAEGGVFYWDTNAPTENATEGEPARPSLSSVGSGVAEELLARRNAWESQHQVAASRANAGERIITPSALEAMGHKTAPNNPPTGPGGRRLGSLFHAVIQRLPLRNDDRTDTEKMAENLARLEGKNHGATSAEVAEVSRLCLGICDNVEYRSLLDEAETVRQEVPFVLPLSDLPELDLPEEGFVEGSIDLLVRSRERTHILDYKTDRLDGADPERAAERYWPQLIVYGLAAKACGHTAGPVDLLVFFVRPQVFCRRRLTSDLLKDVELPAVDDWSR